MSPYQLEKYIINPSLEYIGLGQDQSATNLLLMTAGVESELFEYVHQINGPALGGFQMEPFTHDDIWDNFINYNRHLKERIKYCPQAERMVYDMRYATIMARMLYYRFDEPLPDRDDIRGLAEYYKQYYNTYEGESTVEEAIDKYKELVLI